MTQQSTESSYKLVDTTSIINIINKHSTITNAVNALSQQLPFDKTVCRNMILQLIRQNDAINLIDDKNEHKNDNNIDEETETMIAEFNNNELNELKEILTHDNNQKPL
eukprot:100507_1